MEKPGDNREVERFIVGKIFWYLIKRLSVKSPNQLNLLMMQKLIFPDTKKPDILYIGLFSGYCQFSNDLKNCKVMYVNNKLVDSLKLKNNVLYL